MSAFDRIVNALAAHGAWPGEPGKGNAHCVAHNDATPSLSVAAGPDRALVSCHAGCETEAVMAALTLPMAALFDRWWSSNGDGGAWTVAIYTYTDEHGAPLFEVVRKSDKTFRQRRPDGHGGWIWKLGDTRRVLYRLPKVNPAVANGTPVWIAEGEKDVHALERAGVVATCNPMGAGKWRDDYAEFLRGAIVIVVADRDSEGAKHARKVAASLQGVAKLVNVCEAATGKDAHDHFAAGHGLLDFLPWEKDRHAEPAEPEPEPEPAKDEPPASMTDRYAGRVLDVPWLLEQPDEPTVWRCHGLAADGYLTVLAGKGGQGKSWLALALAMGVALGKPAAGIACRKGRSLIFDAENGPKLIARRLHAIQLPAGCDIQPVDAGGLHLARDFDFFRDTIRRERADFVVFDSLRVLSSGVKENDGDVMEPLITKLKELARETLAAIWLIHHRGKSDEQEYRGSSVILDQADLLFTLGRVKGDPEGRTRRTIVTSKCRIEEEPPPRWVKIEADRTRRLVTVIAAEPFESEDGERPRDNLRDPILAALGGIPRSRRSIAKAVARDGSDGTVRRVLDDLEHEGLAARKDGGWVAGQLPRAIEGGPPGPPPESGSTTGFEGGPAPMAHRPTDAGAESKNEGVITLDFRADRDDDPEASA